MANGVVKVQYRKSAGVWVQNTQGMGVGEGIYQTKAQAVSDSRGLANRKGAKLKIYRKDGSLQETIDYSDNRSGSKASGGGGLLGGGGLF